MSRLWQSVLENVRIIGNHSGCHQMAERSFFYKGKQFPVCARCTGVFIGQVLAIMFSFSTKIKVNFLMSGLLLAVMGTDWGLQALKINVSNNYRRLITGICGGFGLFTIYILIIKRLYQFSNKWLRSIIREQQKLMIKKKLPLLDWLIKKSSYVVVWRGSV